MDGKRHPCRPQGRGDLWPFPGEQLDACGGAAEVVMRELEFYDLHSLVEGLMNNLWVDLNGVLERVGRERCFDGSRLSALRHRIRRRHVIHVEYIPHGRRVVTAADAGGGDRKAGIVGQLD